MFSIQTGHDVLYYSDEGIQAEIWKAARQHDGIRALDINSFSVSVKEGVVLLTGHLTRNSHRRFVEEIACSLPGVRGVQNELIVDPELTIQVAERLSMDERTRRFIFRVGSAHGWVRLGGVVPRRELQMTAEAIAAQVPFVRGVLSRPRLVGENPETERRPIQPQIQSKVYDYNRHEGVVTHVVIQPRNRLVTHAVVSTSGFHDGKFLFYEYFVPIQAMEVVNKESIFLKRKGPPLNAFPAFEASDYPPAPVDWRPPYPYTAGTVRWSCEESERAQNKSSSNRLLPRQR